MTRLKSNHPALKLHEPTQHIQLRLLMGAAPLSDPAPVPLTLPLSILPATETNCHMSLVATLCSHTRTILACLRPLWPSCLCVWIKGIGHVMQEKVTLVYRLFMFMLLSKAAFDSIWTKAQTSLTTAVSAPTETLHSCLYTVFSYWGWTSARALLVSCSSGRAV